MEFQECLNLCLIDSEDCDSEKEEEEEELFLQWYIGSHLETRLFPGLRFSLSEICDEDCLRLFRFTKEQIHVMVAAFGLPTEFVAANRVKCNAIEGLCILLRRFCYPNRWFDLEGLFFRDETCLCNLFQEVNGFLYQKFSSLLLFDKQRLSSSIETFADIVKRKGAPYHRCWGFIDGTLMHISRPTYDQREQYNGHKRHHGLKFQTIVTPDGIIAHIFGPISGRRHDSFMLRVSKLCDELRCCCFRNNTWYFIYIYGDPAYPKRKIPPFKGSSLSPEKTECNKKMSKVREAVEWGYGQIVRLWAFLDFSKNLKMYLSPVATFYINGAFLTNIHTILNGGNQTSTYFETNPPTLEEYLHLN